MTQSVELLLDDELDVVVRRQWDALAAAGLPSQGLHPSETNRPHVTLTVAGTVPAYLETALKAALTGRLPVPIRLGAVLCFAERSKAGTGRQVLARAVVPTVELLELHATCAALFGDLPGAGPLLRPGAWSPHVTLARKVTIAQVATALDVLGRGEEPAGAGVEIRRWDSDARSAWLVTRPRG